MNTDDVHVLRDAAESAAGADATPAGAEVADAPRPKPLSFARGSPERTALIVLAVLGVVATLALARALLIPVALSLLASLVLAPGVRAMANIGIPRLAGSLLAVLASLALLAGLAFMVAQPAQEWFERAPQMLEKIEQRAREWRRPIQAASDATERVMALGDTKGASVRNVVVRDEPTPLVALMQNTPAFVTSVIASTFLVFLLLLHGEELLRKAITLVPSLHAKKEVVAGTREAQGDLSRYLFTVSAINAALGLVSAAALWLLDMPDPLLWGGVIAIANFAPYVGPALVAILLLGAALAEFTGLGQALAVPGVFLFLHAIEGQLVTPLLVGRRLALDPVVLFVGLMLFGWLWGIAGLLMAVPLIACLKVVVAHLPGGDRWSRVLAK